MEGEVHRPFWLLDSRVSCSAVRCAVYPADFRLATPFWIATSEQVGAEVKSEVLVHAVEYERIDGGVDETKTESDNLEDLPGLVELRFDVEGPDDVDVSGEPAHDEDDDERQNDLCHSLPCLDALEEGGGNTVLPGIHLVSGLRLSEQNDGDQRVERCNDDDWNHEVDDESEHLAELLVSVAPLFRIGIAHVDL